MLRFGSEPLHVCCRFGEDERNRIPTHTFDLFVSARSCPHQHVCSLIFHAWRIGQAKYSDKRKCYCAELKTWQMFIMSVSEAAEWISAPQTWRLFCKGRSDVMCCAAAGRPTLQPCYCYCILSANAFYSHSRVLIIIIIINKKIIIIIMIILSA